MKIFISSQRGVSLIQVMVGFALLGVLSMFMMGVFDQQNKLNTKVKVDADLNEVKYHFMNMLNDQVACNANLQLMKKGDTITNFRVDDGAPFATVGKQFKTLDIKITGMKILTNQEVTNSGQTPHPIRPEDGRTMIVFRVSFEKLKGIGGKTINKDFNVSVLLGEHKIVTGPSASWVKSQCPPFRPTDSEFRVSAQYDSMTEEQPVNCAGLFCEGGCVRFTPENANMRVLTCITPGS